MEHQMHIRPKACSMTPVSHPVLAFSLDAVTRVTMNPKHPLADHSCRPMEAEADSGASGLPQPPFLRQGFADWLGCTKGQRPQSWVWGSGDSNPGPNTCCVLGHVGAC